MTVRVDHVAVWTHDLERLRAFYERYFGARAGPLYRSATRPGFSSYFLSFPGGDSRIELMTQAADEGPDRRAVGYAHVAMAVGSPAHVEALTARMRSDGVRVLSQPRRTGDGYFEAVVEDPDGNPVEVVAV